MAKNQIVGREVSEEAKEKDLCVLDHDSGLAILIINYLILLLVYLKKKNLELTMNTLDQVQFHIFTM